MLVKIACNRLTHKLKVFRVSCKVLEDKRNCVHDCVLCRRAHIQAKLHYLIHVELFASRASPIVLNADIEKIDAQFRLMGIEAELIIRLDAIHYFRI